ncbi:hypothetical protein ACFU5O_23265 [Streptomyces sp. NPDC057445]|uniref:hypothetical protein n=1 Tax=Streptomyces sp. NPDC057445 TaxID=3346136 RepID=UPI0036BD6F79
MRQHGQAVALAAGAASVSSAGAPVHQRSVLRAFLVPMDGRTVGQHRPGPDVLHQPRRLALGLGSPRHPDGADDMRRLRIAAARRLQGAHELPPHPPLTMTAITITITITIMTATAADSAGARRHRHGRRTPLSRAPVRADLDHAVDAVRRH